MAYRSALINFIHNVASWHTVTAVQFELTTVLSLLKSEMSRSIIRKCHANSEYGLMMDSNFFLSRFLELTTEHSFFLFGARGTGKSTLLEKRFHLDQNLYINLLDVAEEDTFARHPNQLIALVEALSADVQYVIIDEIQKVPKLLDIIHLLIESRKSQKIFILTGSSARKLKISGVNLLAGRAFVYYLYPLSFLEIGESFQLEGALQWGLLPKIISLKTEHEKIKFLQAYTLTYLKEEVWAEQLVRKIDPFRKFLEVAAQSNGKILNYNKIARQVGADDKTVKNYFTILEDTLLGFMLEPFHHSFRKRLSTSPKFYFFDIGVVRAISQQLTLQPTPKTSYYGDLFEQFVIVECVKLASYFKYEFRFSYLMTAAGVEIDLVVERPGQNILFIEIKSHRNIQEDDLTSMHRIMLDFVDAEAVCFSQDQRKKKIGEVMVFPWEEGVSYYFGSR